MGIGPPPVGPPLGLPPGGMMTARSQAHARMGSNQPQHSLPRDAFDRIGKCLVTGATGQIGSECIRQLNAAGLVPMVLLRRPLPREAWRGVPIEEIPGDLESLAASATPPPLRQALSRTHVLFHLAARVNLAGRGADEMARINHHATLGLFRAARECGVQRFVHVSTTGTVGCSTQPIALDENTLYNLASFRNPYFDTKRSAEETLLEAWRNNREATQLVIVNPSVTVGRMGSFRRLARARKRRAPPEPGSFLYKLVCFWFEGGVNLVDVRDVARGILLAGMYGKPGRRYILGGDNLTIRDLMLELQQIFGTSGPRIRLSTGFLRGAAIVCEAWASLTGRRPRLNRTLARLAGVYWFYDSALAKRDLGYHSRPILKTLTDLRDWGAELREGQDPA